MELAVTSHEARWKLPPMYRTLTRSVTSASKSRRPTPSHWFGAGIFFDIRARAPWYLSDWTDAWNYRVVPATALIFFAKYVVSYLKAIILAGHSSHRLVSFQASPFHWT